MCPTPSVQKGQHYRQLHILGLKSESRGRLTAVIPGSWASHPDAVRIMTAGKKESRH